MPVPPVALAACARIKKNAPIRRTALLRLSAELKNAMSEARKADAKSAISFWGRVKDLSDRMGAERKLLEPTFDDAELLVKHRRELPEADALLITVRQLVDAVQDLVDDLDALVTEAKRISDKSGLLAKVKAQAKEQKIEPQFTKAYDAGMAAIGVLTIVLTVLKVWVRRKSVFR